MDANSKVQSRQVYQQKKSCLFRSEGSNGALEMLCLDCLDAQGYGCYLAEYIIIEDEEEDKQWKLKIGRNVLIRQSQCKKEKGLGFNPAIL
jgi:hypothetical protein